jgi:hypothetical protein
MKKNNMEVLRSALTAIDKAPRPLPAETTDYVIAVLCWVLKDKAVIGKRLRNEKASKATIPTAFRNSLIESYIVEAHEAGIGGHKYVTAYVNGKLAAVSAEFKKKPVSVDIVKRICLLKRPLKNSLLYYPKTNEPLYYPKPNRAD